MTLDTDTDTGTADAAAGDDLYADIASAMRGETAAEPGIGHNGGPEMDAEARARDERGRFAATDTPADAAPKGAPAEEETKADQPAPEGDSKQEKLAPPEGWSDDAKVRWDRLPRSVQEELLNRSAATPPTEATRAQPDPVVSALKPHIDALAASGRDPGPWIANAAQWAAAYERDPGGTVQALARQGGIDLAQFATPNAAQGGRQSQQDPQVAALQQKVQQLEGYLTQQQRDQSAAAMAEQQRLVEAFSSEKDAAGKATRPHFGEVRQEMARLIQAEIATSLQDAYDKAVWSHPTIRQRILEAERQAEAEKRAADERKTAEAARAKGVSVRNNPGPGNLAPQSAGDLESEIRSAFRAHS